jgi:hypothetical protein
MADFQLASVLVDLLSGIQGTVGLYEGQRAIAKDFNGAELYWDGTSQWKWARTWQPIKLVRSTPTPITGTLTETDALNFTLPALGPNDMVRVHHFWTVGNVATNKVKTVRVRLDGTAGQAVDLNIGATTPSSGNMVVEIRNMNNASAQKWFTNSPSVFGTSSLTLEGTNKVTSTGKVLRITGKLADATDSLTCEWSDVWICGGG